ncbi:diguanylate cyclase domain-containing protein [Neobacillus sp. 19]|uniref:sensor domain-containing diguanylate cyclase n=1 Tax=Neobacillus sp. 19 TaxID=3394458 RepID=UPI003BF6F8B2
MDNLFNRFQPKSVSDQEFLSDFYNILWDRLKFISYMLIFTYPCFIVVDFIFLKKLEHLAFRTGLISIHLICLVISLIFIIIYRCRDNRSKVSIVNTYILLYLLIGAASSLNSQLYTGNMYVYIIILLAAAMVFPAHPRTMFVLYLGIQIIFITGLYLLDRHYYSFILKLINSTGAAAISFTLTLAFYSFQKNDFLNKRKLRKNEESFRSLFNMSPNPLILVRLEDEEIVLMNKQAAEYYHLDGRKLEELDLHFLFPNVQEKQEIIDRLTELQSIKNYVMETPVLKRWVLLHFELVDYLDHPCMLMGITDITDLKQKEAELLHHASIDALTGAFNRRRGLELIREHLQTGPNAKPFILCYIDINNLKIVNDQFGHATGDDLIKTICETIHHQIDDSDVLIRLGGDEFIVLFFQKPLIAVEQVWANLETAFKTINERREKPYHLSASHGWIL